MVGFKKEMFLVPSFLPAEGAAILYRLLTRWRERIFKIRYQCLLKKMKILVEIAMKILMKSKQLNTVEGGGGNNGC